MFKEKRSAPHLTAEDVRVFIEQEVEKAGVRGVRRKDLREALFRGRETDAPRIRGLLASAIKSLPIIGVGDRWYLEEFAPEEEISPAPEKEEVLAPRTEQFHNISSVRMRTPYGIVSLEEIDANVTLTFNL